MSVQPVQFTLTQTTSVQAGDVFRVLNQITAHDNAPDDGVFVFKTATQVFDHYASAFDYQTYPVGQAAAQTAGTPFYRANQVQRDWPNVGEMRLDVNATKSRVQALATELTKLAESAPGVVTTVITGATS